MNKSVFSSMENTDFSYTIKIKLQRSVLFIFYSLMCFFMILLYITDSDLSSVFLKFILNEIKIKNFYLVRNTLGLILVISTV